MERAEWLAKVRRANAERFGAVDAAPAPTYDGDRAELGPTQRAYAERLAGSAPEGGAVLDASAGMIAAPEALSFDAEFDAAMCVDALENLPPEDWPAVLAGLRRAVRPGGLVYLTVGLPDGTDLDQAYESGRAAGLPVAAGELAEAGGGYRYYPDADRVGAWLREAGLDLVEETPADGHRHLLCRAGSSPQVEREREGASVRALLAGAVVMVAAGLGVLLVAGSFGVTGVVLAIVIEAAFVYGLYRYGPSRTA